MKYKLPKNHNLSGQLLDAFIHKNEEGEVEVTDIQYDALENGVARGESLLVIAPTSTGKTLIGQWAIGKSLIDHSNCVYLVTHRALAKQKFEKFKESFLSSFLNDEPTSIVLATGDIVCDSEGKVPIDPLHAPILIATYEKYLGMLASSGIPKDMSNTVVVCDEIQLIGDPSRGQSVELLLTLLKRSGWKQFVGLSAVLESSDAKDLASWLNLKLVRSVKREKSLVYECWTDNEIISINTEFDNTEPTYTKTPLNVDIKNTVNFLRYLIEKNSINLPVIVFCMTKGQISDLSSAYEAKVSLPATLEENSLFSELPETTANNLLSRYIPKKFAFHSADLTEEERAAVEESLINRKVEVIFSTTTLGAGVNFPLGTAIFHSWERWNQERKMYEAISKNEFHNMAGRVGRMGSEHESGKVIFKSNSGKTGEVALDYLDISSYASIKTHITPLRFELLTLQLFGAELANDRPRLYELVKSTLSGSREQVENLNAFNQWESKLSETVSFLLNSRFLIENSRGDIKATQLGRAVAQSGFQPRTAIFLLEYIAIHGETLIDKLATCNSNDELDNVAFALFHACFSSPEFEKYKTRFLPYQLKNYRSLPLADACIDLLIEPKWSFNPISANSAQLALNWISGMTLKDIETSFQDISAGSLSDLSRSLSWLLQGFSVILSTITDIRVPLEQRPSFFKLPDETLLLLKKLPRLLSRLSYQVSVGLPENVLWMNELEMVPGPSLSRHEILQLVEQGLTKPETCMLGDDAHNQLRVNAFNKGKPTPQARANAFRNTVRYWKKRYREKIAEKHSKRAEKIPGLKDIIHDFYNKRGHEFENAFESLLSLLPIEVERLDTNATIGAPDYLLKFENREAIVFELKTKENEKLVDYNKATEVLSASEIHGYKNNFCLTLCHPGVDPSVPNLIVSCGRLAVIESVDLGEAIIRTLEKNISEEQLYNWLTTPGQALTRDLPFKSFYI